jgi:superfamily II RNA helicase
MVKICNTSIYTNDKYTDVFSSYPFELSPFQRYALEGIIEGAHVLVTAHTGSGKTLPAEFSIEHFVSQGKKVIYTAPIKALSNQKFYEFQKKFPHISFGILTGDIKANPIADVLIMTTEILMNTLYLKLNSKQIPGDPQSSSGMQDFEMDFSQLGCVVFDEVHYINDVDRGRVWEETIMMLPQHVQMVMLSATIDRPEEFAGWIETIKSKPVYLCPTNHRVVPLTHYTFLTTNSGLFKKVKDKATEQEFNTWANKIQAIQTSTGKFSDLTHKTNKKFLNLLEDKQVKVSRPHVLNNVCEYMVQNEMLPALCFVLSRKQLETAAHEVTVGLLEFDSKVPYTAAYECEQIIRKLPNYQEYLELPEYIQMVKLIEKGIAIHHSGVMPVLKEMVELLYARGFIKLLFATETFSIGVNMPTKTVLFTDLTKFDGNISRPLYSHEYSQMAGRAGRRGIDTVGHVIHLVNLFRSHPDIVTYKTVLCGKPQHLVSKFKIGYNLILNMIGLGLGSKDECVSYASKSMVAKELGLKAQGLELKLESLQTSSSTGFNLSSTRTPPEVIEEYVSLSSNVKMLVNKKRKEAERRLATIKDEYKFLNQDIESYQSAQATKTKIVELGTQLDLTNNYMGLNIDRVLQYLESKGFVEIGLESGELIQIQPQLTPLGSMAIHIKETHCLVWAGLIADGSIGSLSVEDLVGFLSCFTTFNVPDDYKIYSVDGLDGLASNELKELIRRVATSYSEYQSDELGLQISSGTDYTIHFDMVTMAIQWTKVENPIQAKEFVGLYLEPDGNKIFLGEFVKAILKIVNIANELIKITRTFGLVELEHKLAQIPGLVLKFVATNQSLYV